MTSNTAPTVLTQLALDDNARPRYSAAKLDKYFDLIKLPQSYRSSPIVKDPTKVASREYGLPFLQALTRYHTCNVPFENLELHYSPHKTVTLNPTDLYDKIVNRRRGGRCMENNTFLATVLRSLGFIVRNCGGRVARAMSPYPEVRQNQSSTYDGWNHMLNLVRLDDEWYVVDVGMGSMGPNLPYPLRDGFETTSIAPRKIRLQLRAIAETYSMRPSAGAGEVPKLWCYDVCIKPSEVGEEVWTPTYCFTETEFLPQDYEVMSWYTSTHERSFFTRYVTCTKMIMDDAGELIVGNITLFQQSVKEMVDGKSRVVRVCKTEAERLHVLEKVFGVYLSESEKIGIPAEMRLGGDG